MNTIEELRQVDVHRVCVSFLEAPTCLGDCGLSSSTTAKAVTAIVKDRFKSAPIVRECGVKAPAVAFGAGEAGSIG